MSGLPEVMSPFAPPKYLSFAERKATFRPELQLEVDADVEVCVLDEPESAVVELDVDV
jgi:hypothetical protein